ncbi:polyketide cyclase [Nocardioides anomalus]|uniref:Polyketide cyclase n=1 Tax=Nocardioides anomalus TaxID=2712223 RepID=A0A6G6WEH8_9ACTN|nr:SRPBCC domain-containing protein [Nocardioides anomalus]QIG43634.1 polyketide cyclase [Nocardioides anomalus]
MERDTIAREVRIDATPDVVYEVVSTPEHMREWWSDGADASDQAGTIRITFGADESKSETLTVIDEDPPNRFSFRWIQDAGQPGTSPRSLLVTFDLVPAGDGTLLRFSESGFADKAWDASVRDETYSAHTTGWDLFLSRLVTYTARVGASA